MLAIALALGASVCWGSADFLGGLTTRRASLWAVVVGSQVVGLTGATLLALALGRPFPGFGVVWPVILGGAAGTIAIPTFYTALAIGTMSTVAPISATSALVPFIAGLAMGERPSGAQLAGAALAAVGVLLVASEPARREEAVGAPALPGGPAVEPLVAITASVGGVAGRDPSPRTPSPGSRPGGGPTPNARAATPPTSKAQRKAIVLALVASVCIGITLLGYDAVARHDPVWAMLGGRASTAVFFSLFLLALRPRLAATTAAVPGIVAIGLMDTGANGLFAFATTQGYLSIVSVLGSIYPAVTVGLASAVLRERIAPHQRAGVVATLAGVALIAAA